jgi:hypothetical protein
MKGNKDLEYAAEETAPMTDAFIAQSMLKVLADRDKELADRL